jgi:hypothetical protein
MAETRGQCWTRNERRITRQQQRGNQGPAHIRILRADPGHAPLRGKGGERTFMFTGQVDSFRGADNPDEDAIAVASDRGIPDSTPQFESTTGSQHFLSPKFHPRLKSIVNGKTHHESGCPLPRSGRLLMKEHNARHCRSRDAVGRAPSVLNRNLPDAEPRRRNQTTPRRAPCHPWRHCVIKSSTSF